MTSSQQFATKVLQQARPLLRELHLQVYAFEPGNTDRARISSIYTESAVYIGLALPSFRSSVPKSTECYWDVNLIRPLQLQIFAEGMPMKDHTYIVTTSRGGQISDFSLSFSQVSF